MGSKSKILFKVEAGRLVPACNYARESLRKLNLKVGDLVCASITLPRSNGFNRYVHAIGRLVSVNISGFEHLNSHEVIKRLQVESGSYCDYKSIDLPNLGKCLVATPHSLSFGSMSEAEFRDFSKKICLYLSEKYWPSLTADQIEAMSIQFVNNDG